MRLSGLIGTAAQYIGRLGSIEFEPLHDPTRSIHVLALYDDVGVPYESQKAQIDYREYGTTKYSFVWDVEAIFLHGLKEPDRMHVPYEQFVEFTERFNIDWLSDDWRICEKDRKWFKWFVIACERLLYDPETNNKEK